MYLLVFLQLLEPQQYCFYSSSSVHQYFIIYSIYPNDIYWKISQNHIYRHHLYVSLVE